MIILSLEKGILGRIIKMIDIFLFLALSLANFYVAIFMSATTFEIILFSIIGTVWMYNFWMKLGDL